jgi:hypothetical protein
LDRLLQYPREAEALQAATDAALKDARRDRRLVELERREFQRQYSQFLKWQSDNTALREQLRRQAADALSVQRQLAAVQTSAQSSGQVKAAAALDAALKSLARARQGEARWQALSASRGNETELLRSEVSVLHSPITLCFVAVHDYTIAGMAQSSMWHLVVVVHQV